MNWQPLESKMFVSAAYNAEKSILYLRFHRGDVYRYFEFPRERYNELLTAESHGRYFLSRIRNQFPYERLAKLQAA